LPCDLFDVRRALRFGVLCTSFLAVHCTCESSSEGDGHSAPTPVPTPSPVGALDSGARETETVRRAAMAKLPRRRCPREMVDVDGLFCIDRYEVSLVDARRGRPLSPFYPPTRAMTRKLLEQWQQRRETVGPSWARALAPPEPPDWQWSEDFEPQAVVAAGVVPSGYLSGHDAERACSNAGKRLCSEVEWVTACRGKGDLPFPYGPKYEAGACNVMRSTHPAALLHDNPSIGHLDPRLNLAVDDEGPLLQDTGASPRCQSRWGDDAIYDMVGNLDEWIADDDGTFLGGFFSRQTNKGCASRIATHPYGYFDYSLGTRCCL
jgi:sulfatase-modifying factor enzyme 1